MKKMLLLIRAVGISMLFFGFMGCENPTDSTTTPSNDVRAFIHPGVLHSGEKLDYLRGLITKWDNGDIPAVPSNTAPEAEKAEYRAYYSWNDFKNHTDSQADVNIQNSMGPDFTRAYQNALMWSLTGITGHADKAFEILYRHATTVTEIAWSNNTPLNVGFWTRKIMATLELLKHTGYAGYYAKEPDGTFRYEKIHKMLYDHFIPILEWFYRTPPYTNGNWGAILNAAYMGVGIYFDDREIYDFAKNFYLNAYDNGSLKYYLDDTGQCQESGRDNSHALMGLGNLAWICETAWIQGDDLWSAMDNRLLKGYEYAANHHNGGPDVTSYKVWRDITGKYSDWQMIATGNDPGRPVYAIAWNHYVRRKGLPMPETEELWKQVLTTTKTADGQPIGEERGIQLDMPPFHGSFFFYEPQY
jgi:hypothetical protein